MMRVIHGLKFACRHPANPLADPLAARSSAFRQLTPFNLTLRSGFNEHR